MYAYTNMHGLAEYEQDCYYILKHCKCSACQASTDCVA